MATSGEGKEDDDDRSDTPTYALAVDPATALADAKEEVSEGSGQELVLPGQFDPNVGFVVSKNQYEFLSIYWLHFQTQDSITYFQYDEAVHGPILATSSSSSQGTGSNVATAGSATSSSAGSTTRPKPYDINDPVVAQDIQYTVLRSRVDYRV